MTRTISRLVDVAKTLVVPVVFVLAWHAAVKRTRAECDWIFGKIPEHLVARFRDLPS